LNDRSQRAYVYFRYWPVNDRQHATEAVWKRVGEAVHAEGPC